MNLTHTANPRTKFCTPHVYTHLSKAVIFIAAIATTIACTPNRAYRTDYKPCTSTDPVKECVTATIQYYTDPADAERQYMLGFTEFDDHGLLYDRKQMQVLIDTLYNEAAQSNLLMVVFVHGWHHNAETKDNNIQNFRSSLLNLSKLERVEAQANKRKPRKVVGIYTGWRGESITVPYINTITFWDRKSTAQTVGHGGITELFARLEEIRNIKESLDTDTNEESNRLVVVGHSFGGAVAFSALSQILMNRFVDTKGPVGTASTSKGFGDLVVLINPAFEALQFSTLSDMANERGSYFDNQPPVLSILTSEADYATKYAFWFGQVLAVATDKHRNITRINKASGEKQKISEWKADTTAIGHYKPYITHRLNPDTREQNVSLYQALQDVRNAWLHDAPGKTIPFPGTVLNHLNTSVARNPYMIIQVDKSIIPGHNEIYDPRVASFLSSLIMLSTTRQTAPAP